MDFSKAEHFIGTITPYEVERYTRYLGTIKPVTEAGLFKRWLFAFASVHTTWEMNCKLYHALVSDMSWIGGDTKLHQLITDTRCGLQNQRTINIGGFSRWFNNHPDWFWKSRFESWVGYRDRIMERVRGIGQAKSSFVIEMTYPLECEVLCTDSHVFQHYGYSTKDIGAGRVGILEERAIEAHWVETCKKHQVAPTIARWVFWDRKKQYSDSRYWTHVFERQDYNELFKRISYA
jgi:hypothetical protein